MTDERLISTHAPRTGSDLRAGRAGCDGQISTHAPRTGSDQALQFVGRKYSDFNPRSPHGERPLTARESADGHGFQPTLPARGATIVATPSHPVNHHFNPRSPHGERRVLLPGKTPGLIYFNPRSPHGERRAHDLIPPGRG